MQLPNFEVTIRMPDGSKSKRIQPALNATNAGKLVRSFYYYGQDVKISAKSIKGAV